MNSSQELSAQESEIPKSLKIAIYRMMQEDLNNIGKYSKADRVQLSSRKNGEVSELAIQDNGQGFDLEKAFYAGSPMKGLGPSSMRE
jgi:signal transduction histidine kinase